MAVAAGTADMRSRAQAPVELVAPRVIGAADGALDSAGLGHQDHASVPADVQEDAEPPLAVAHHQQRLAEKVDRPRIARAGHVAGKAERRPVAEEDALLFGLEEARLDIERVRQPARGRNGLRDGTKVEGQGHGRPPVLLGRR